MIVLLIAALVLIACSYDEASYTRKFKEDKAAFYRTYSKEPKV